MASRGPPPAAGEGAGEGEGEGEGVEAQAASFRYGEGDLLLGGVEWPGGAPSRFDRALQRGWAERMARGLFRYRLGPLAPPTRVLPGPLGLVAQLNPERAALRRPPQEIRSLRQPFDPRRFSFARIRPPEALFALRPRGRGGGEGRAAGALVVINASPLERGHVLLVPEPARGLPQVLTAGALRCGLEAVLLSARPGFRVGFNGLGAGASVNHLHLHGYYLDRPLPVERAPCRPLLPEAGLFLLLRGVPAPGFLFYCAGGRLEETAGRVARLTDLLLEKGVAHNLFVTRGAPPEGPPAPAPAPRPVAGLRVIVWPRKARFGAKEPAAFNVALCELAGHLPLYAARDFEALTEAEALRTIRQSLLPDAEFAQLQRELVALLGER